MNHFSIINLTIIVINLPIAAFLFLKSKGNKSILLLGCLSLAAAIWGLGSLGYSTTASRIEAKFWWQIASVAAILSTVIFYYFILSYLRIKQKLLSYSINVVTGFYLILNLFYKDLFIGDLEFIFNQFYYISWPNNQVTPYLVFYILFYVFLLIYSFYLLVKEYRKASEIRRAPMKYLIFGMIIGYIGCHACFLPVFQFMIYPYLSILIAVYTIPISYGSYMQMTEENELLRKEIIRTERLKTVHIIAAGLAHEIKNPLTAIKTFTEHLPEKRFDDQYIQKYVHIVGQEADRINNLINELLTFAKPSQPKFERVNINALIDDIVQLVKQQALNAKIKLSVNSTVPEFLIQADSTQLKQAILNIILNALDSMPHGGLLTVDSSEIVYEGRQCFSIKVTDTGVGIDPNDLPNIFDLFFTNKKKGTGLGLAITREIIEKHGGSISVESSLNLGTTFIVFLPKHRR